nr:MAG TPA: type I neck protein [Caudoviricetes sp.]
MRIKVQSIQRKSSLKSSLSKAESMNNIYSRIKSIGSKGLSRLISATPKRSGDTASSWDMDIENSQNGLNLYYSNSKKVSDGTPLVVLIVNGHGTGTGGYVPANDFVSPIVNSIEKEILREVNNIIE